MLENDKTATLDVVLVSPWLPQAVQVAKHTWAEQPSSRHHRRKHRKFNAHLKNINSFQRESCPKPIFQDLCYYAGYASFGVSRLRL